MERDTRTTSGKTFLPSLTGMRFIAAFVVFLLHSALEGNMLASDGLRGTISSIFTQGGWAAVSFFYLLSGFVLTWTARPTDTAPRFWRRRALKIYPIHVLTFVVAAVLLMSVFSMAFNVKHAIINVFLLQSWFPQLDIRGSFNGVTWSLSCEILFYLTFPLLILLVRRIRPERLWAWAIGVVAATFAIPALSVLLPQTPVLPMVNISAAQFWIIYQFPPVRLLDFVLGMLLARIVITGRTLPFGFAGSLALAIASYAIAPLFPMIYALTAIMILPLGLVIATAAIEDRESRRTWVSGRTIVWLGQLSFAIYMWHRLVIQTILHYIGGGRQWSTPVALALEALLFAVCVLLSWLTVIYLEKPLSRRFARPRLRPVPLPTTEPASPLPKAG